MKGGVILFRGTGVAARRYLESDRSTADEYYLEGGTALAKFTVSGRDGEVIETRTLDPEGYSAWVDWTDPITGTSMGTPRAASDRSKESPRFAEMVINAPKSLSIAAALHPEVSEALDVAQQHAASEIRRWLAEHSVTRVGPRNAREIVPVQQLQTVTVAHKTSRAGDPHRHIHFQIGTRVYAAGKWRGLDTAALFKQQGAIRALGTAVIAAHPQLSTVLDRHGLTLDPTTGEVAELEPFNAVMSKRGAQVERNLARFEAEWEAAHPGEEPGPVVRARLKAKAWEHARPGKKPTVLGSEAGWRTELEDAGERALLAYGRLAMSALDRPWKPALDIAAEILGRKAVMPKGQESSTAHAVSISLYMEKWWEQVLADALRMCADRETVSEQLSVESPWKGGERGNADLYFDLDGRTILTDAKYKLEESGIGAADAYQLFAYSHTADAPRTGKPDAAAVFYPVRGAVAGGTSSVLLRVTKPVFHLHLIELPFPSRNDVTTDLAWRSYIERLASQIAVALR